MSIGELGVLLRRSFCGGLEGEEIMKMTLNKTLKNMDAGLGHKTPYIPMALQGKFKGETSDICHLIPIYALIKTGVNNKLWFTWLFGMQR